MPQRQKVKVEKDGGERYLLTYSDLMNLLLILFIILFAMSQIDIEKFNKFAASFREEFGESQSAALLGEGATGNSILEQEFNAPSSVLPSKAEKQQMDNAKETVTKLIQKENLQSQVEVSLQERGVLISIEAQVLFDPGSADLRLTSKDTIIKIGKVLLQMPGKRIRVEGHTDSDPINTQRFPDNLELSTARANSVHRILRDTVGIKDNMLSSVGFGETQPKVPNNSIANKAKNRRVDIVILREAYDTTETGKTTEKTTTDKETTSDKVNTDNQSNTKTNTNKTN